MHDDLLLLDSIRLNFSQASLHLMNISIGFIMFGVALGIKWESFKDIFLNPRQVLVGLGSQFLVLPAVTFLAVWLLGGFITPSVAFGMLLVASCPGGNISNFISSVAKANVELSVSLTALGTMLAVFFTPLNFAFWGGLYSTTSPLLRPIHINPFEMFQTVVILLGIPVIAGIFFSQKLPHITRKIQKPIQQISLVIFGAFVILAFRNNYEYFIEYGLNIYHRAPYTYPGTYGYMFLGFWPQPTRQTHHFYRNRHTEFRTGAGFAFNQKFSHRS
ncbi:MAG: bile acid:sodium symporter [Lentimicrobium sp.]|nr:bile acid:sodium symporter [Lentimicrobium sp.]